jgi:hypothetical protein
VQGLEFQPQYCPKKAKEKKKEKKKKKQRATYITKRANSWKNHSIKNQKSQCYLQGLKSPQLMIPSRVPPKSSVGSTVDE